MKLVAVILVILMLLAGFFTFTACAVPSPLEDYTWILTSYYYNGQSVTALPGTQVTAVFSSKDETVQGSAGCNSYSGKYNLDHMTLSFPQPFISTLMACQNATVNDQEQAYLKILQKADSFEMDHGNLIIHSGIDRLIFRRANATEITITKWGG